MILAIYHRSLVRQVDAIGLMGQQIQRTHNASKPESPDIPTRVADRYFSAQ